MLRSSGEAVLDVQCWVTSPGVAGPLAASLMEEQKCSGPPNPRGFGDLQAAEGQL